MGVSRIKAKGRKEGGTFLALPHKLLDHPDFLNLSRRAVRLLLDLGAQYKGNNNGDLCWYLFDDEGTWLAV